MSFFYYRASVIIKTFRESQTFFFFFSFSQMRKSEVIHPLQEFSSLPTAPPARPGGQQDTVCLFTVPHWAERNMSWAANIDELKFLKKKSRSIKFKDLHLLNLCQSQWDWYLFRPTAHVSLAKFWARYLSSSLDPVLINKDIPRAPSLEYVHQAILLTCNQGQVAKKTVDYATENIAKPSWKLQGKRNLESKINKYKLSKLMLSDTGLQHQHIGTWQKHGLEHLPDGAARDENIRLSRIQGRGSLQHLQSCHSTYTSPRKTTSSRPSLPYL